VTTGPATGVESDTLLSTDDAIDLDNCAREPIHIPGRIQPRGALLAVRDSDLVVTQASANLLDVIGVDVDGAIGRPLVDVVGPWAGSTIQRAGGVFGDLRDRNPIDVVLEVNGRAVPFDAILHRVDDTIVVIELEPAEGPRPFAFPNTYRAVSGIVARLNQAVELEELYTIAAEGVQELTGFDRVMIYRYDAEFNGEVVAEVKRDHLEPFLGLHYPASDIPAQARALYEKNWIRLISDVDYVPAPLVPTLAPSTGAPLDLSLSVLRSVSPVHIEYLHNMGVRASMSISLIRHGVLWGLIACHHYSGPHTPPYAVRAAAEFLGSTLSLRLVDRADEADLRIRLAGQVTLAALTALTLDESRAIALTLLDGPSLLGLVPADGVAVNAEGHLATAGRVPDVETVRVIAAWAALSGESLVATDRLGVTAPHLDVPMELVSGILALPLPEGQYILWFRAEAVQSVDWSGNPDGKVVVDEPGLASRLSPRRSFERWRQVVRSRSRPWTRDQQELAAELRRHVVEALYRRSRRGMHLAETLQRSLLPRSLAGVAGWSISAHYEIAEGGQVGGDWYDALALADGSLAVVLGDVAGHGIAAAGTMAELRNALRAHLIDGCSPAQALTKLNQFVAQVLPSVFATAVVAVIDPGTGRVTAGSAGHLTPCLLARDGRVDFAPLPTAHPLGIRHTVYEDTTFTVPVDAGLVLYSDGLIEQRTEDLGVSQQRLRSILGRLAPGPDATQVFDAVVRPGAFDDATVLALHRST
jgi:chemotaxis family two-component system sensor kinase Cph1